MYANVWQDKPNPVMILLCKGQYSHITKWQTEDQHFIVKSVIFSKFASFRHGLDCLARVEWYEKVDGMKMLRFCYDGQVRAIDLGIPGNEKIIKRNGFGKFSDYL